MVTFSSVPWTSLNKLHENWFEKYALIWVVFSDCIVNEVEHYLKSDISCDDVLQFLGIIKWHTPHLKSLASIALAIAATSTLSQ